MHLFQACSSTATMLTKAQEQIKKLTKKSGSITHLKKSPNPDVPPWAQKYQARGCSVLYHDCRKWPTRSGYAPSEASGKHSIIAGGF